MVVMANLKIVASFVVSNPFIKLRPGIRSPKTILAQFHSNSCSNREAVFMFGKIATCNDAFKLFDEMSQRHPLPSVVKFNHLLQAITKRKHYACSIDLFKQMRVICVPVDVYTMNIVINCCCQLYCTNGGFAVLGSGLKNGLVPSVITYNTILNGLILEDRVVEAEVLFKKLIKEEICQPDKVMYNTMIKGLCMCGNNDTAIALLREMDERGGDCGSNVVTYNTIIYSLCKHKRIEDALKLFEEMDLCSKKYIAPNVITYNSLIYGFCKSSRLTEMITMIKKMVNNSICPDGHTWSIIVDWICKDGVQEEVDIVMEMMNKLGMEADVVTYNILIDRYCCQGELSKAREVFDSMGSQGLVPNLVTYNSLLDGYCKKSKIEDAMHLFHEISKKGLKPDAITYNIILQGLFRVKRCVDAQNLFNEMRANGHTPDEYTYRIVLKGLCINHQLKKALLLFLSMGDDGDGKLNSNNIEVYNILIDGLCKCGKLEMARCLFNDIRLKGLQPNAWTYTSMMSGCFREGLIAEANSVLYRMEQNGFPYDEVTYNVRMKGFLKNKYYRVVYGMLRMGAVFEDNLSLSASNFKVLTEGIADGTLNECIAARYVQRLAPKRSMDSAC